MPDVLFIEFCNFEDFPVGGQLSFARQMVHAFGSRLALVGMSTDDTPVGRWVKRAFDGTVCNFFSVGRWRESARKPIVPDRLKAYYRIRRYRRQILSAGIRSAFISTPEGLLASYKWGWNDLCFLFSGLDSPLHMPRYKWAELFADVFDSHLVSAAQSASLLLAAADRSTIREFSVRTGGRIPEESIISFPTRADTDIFHPADQTEARRKLGVPEKVPVFVTVGRVNRRKGWDLLVEAFRHLLTRRPEAHLYFVGDGEDRPKVESRLRELGLAERAHITGYLDRRQIAAYLNAANVFVLASYFEGWPTVMVEALATGKAIVSTSVSAAAESIDNGRNGYIVHGRDARVFCDAMIKALSLDARSHSLSKSRPYALNSLAEDLGRLWAPLRVTKEFQCSLC
ncbi:MAG: glycosyltransferase [Planctomycetota bacterium]|jgi:glycosyltransferase involved in cell wall biosynthesis